MIDTNLDYMLPNKYEEECRDEDTDDNEVLLHSMS